MDNGSSRRIEVYAVILHDLLSLRGRCRMNEYFYYGSRVRYRPGSGSAALKGKFKNDGSGLVYQWLDRCSRRW